MQVVAHRGSDLQVIACAGAGKTEAISRRIASLLADGADPDSIVAFTFTERAAGELNGKAAFRQGTDVCSSGYYHGVTEAVMTRIGREHILERAVEPL